MILYQRIFSDFNYIEEEEVLNEAPPYREIISFSNRLDFRLQTQCSENQEDKTVLTKDTILIEQILIEMKIKYIVWMTMPGNDSIWRVFPSLGNCRFSPLRQKSTQRTLFTAVPEFRLSSVEVLKTSNPVKLPIWKTSIKCSKCPNGNKHRTLRTVELSKVFCEFSRLQNVGEHISLEQLDEFW